MSSELEAVERFGLVCLAVWNMMDEESLSLEDALKAVRQMMRPHSKPRDVAEGMKRLAGAADEGELLKLLDAEATRMSRIVEASRMTWPTSLFP